MKNDILKLNYVNVINKYNKNQKIYLDKQKLEVIKKFKKIQVNNKKFINCFVFNIKNNDLENRLKKLNFPAPNFVLKNKNNDYIQIIYMLESSLNIYNQKVKNYYNDIYTSMLKHLKINVKNNDNLMINNLLNENLVETVNMTFKPYLLSDFKHLIVKDNYLCFKNNRYSFSNNYIFNYLNIYSLKNTYLIVRNGKNEIEKRVLR